MKPKTKILGVRVTEAEYSKIEDEASGKKMRVSEYVRSVLLAPANVDNYSKSFVPNLRGSAVLEDRITTEPVYDNGM